MVRRVLTDADRYAILTAPDTETTAALATRLGKGYGTVYAVRAQIRDGTWSCDLTMGACDTCDQPMLIPPHSGGMKRHRGCDTEHNRRRQQRLRQTDDTFRQTIYDRSRRRQDILQETTRGLDRQSRQRWSAEDDQYLWDHRDEVYTPDGISRLADTLGRSFAACQTRLTRLQARDSARRRDD